MTPWLVRLWRSNINRTLARHQKITHIAAEGLEHVRAAVERGAGVLLTPNHSFHYDSYVMIEMGHRIGRPLHFLTAWQVFAMSKPFERRVLQWHGCYSINREANDLQAFKASIEILRESPFPLIIFPEGDIYHCNDRVTPFREGAAAIALSAAKKGPREIVAVPCALKCFYVQDPTPELAKLMTRLEDSLHWRPRTELSLEERIYKFADGLLALKEIEYLGDPQRGNVVDRARALADVILKQLEGKYGLAAKGIIPERVKECRRAIIKALEVDGKTPAELAALSGDMNEVFLVIQLFSYPADYIRERPTIERIAETLDKFEEDVLRADFPGIRGERHAIVKFGEPIPVAAERDNRHAVSDLTDKLETRVQALLDEINAARPASGGCKSPEEN